MIPKGFGIERNWCVWAEHWRRNGHSTKRHTTKLSFSMTMLGHMSQDQSRHTGKRWNRKSHPTRPDPGTALALNFRVAFYRYSSPCFGVLIYYLIGFIRGLSKASKVSFRGCLPKCYATHCPRDMVVPGLIFTSGAKVALLYGQGQDSGNTDLLPFFGGSCRRPTRF